MKIEMKSWGPALAQAAGSQRSRAKAGNTGTVATDIMLQRDRSPSHTYNSRIRLLAHKRCRSRSYFIITSTSQSPHPTTSTPRAVDRQRATYDVVVGAGVSGALVRHEAA